MDIYQFLTEHEIDYERHDHPPVYTCEDVNQLVPELPGAKTKNLFVRDQKGKRHFLVSVPDEKSVDLKALAPLLGVDKLSFGSPKRLKKYLDLEPGAVTILAALNDTANAVQVVIDEDLWQADALLYHPLVNTSTVLIAREQVERFLAATGHTPRILKIPSR
ncbi:prolyl-tRNA synthetase associated domain-containing protein [candidate division KSB3 bacterium]|jgi:Ala-tRNA(Pro) deacylase|uniref:Prolyl-tRNA synthetase associated domain-containing protein n=1 Tax=candidate division KSB3 bacterium TaxID=2044937 RepID=A0A9D5JU86_9BACT|nr:prolyl-tRNA synthetase associated domain-containing protein [candidate division KSB3 bacterium]MBD3324339.1 prolyl-tRNA synthetase associated domain-containing protein [candidate division KSB3 bacterium]